jgi:hypothetical protein
MKKSIGVLIMVGLVSGSSEARAQTAPDARTFFDINGGVQVLSPALDAGTSFLQFGETGTIRTIQKGGAGLLVDARLGHRIRRRLALAIAVSGSRKSPTGTGAVSLPSPIVVASPTVVNVEVPGLTRREIGYHPQIVWSTPWTKKKFNISVFAGPSFVHLQQNLIAATINANQAVTTSTSNESGMAFGAHAGVDATRPMSDRWGVGFFARYVLGAVDLPSASGVKVGGLQISAGLRFTF